MSRRTPLALLGAAVLILAAAVAPAGALAANTIDIRGGVTVKPGKAVIDTQRFTPLVKGIKSGSTLTIRNKAKTKDPHTFSIVKKSQLVKTPGALNSCFENGVCGALFAAHEVPEGDGPPGKPVVDVGKEGFDQPGDSVIIGGPTATKVKITAAKGSNLYYLCAIHPWMQGRLNVR